MQSFDSVSPYLELAILSRMLRLTEHAQSSAVEYFYFLSAEFSSSLQDLHFTRLWV